MARIILTDEPAAVDVYEDVVAVLADELTADPAGSIVEPLRQPIIIEQGLRGLDSLHVAVIWERWRRVPANGRSRAILEAYERAEPAKVDQILIALPATFGEAANLGLLPWGVEPTEAGLAALGEGGVAEKRREFGAVSTPDGVFFRFPSKLLAETTRGRLDADTGSGHWQLVPFERPRDDGD